jgi:hypothetical protein
MDVPKATNFEQTESRRGRITRRAQGFWSSDRSLTVLLVLLVANIFIVPLARFATWGRLGGRAILSLTIISGLIATVRDRRVILPAVALTVVSVVMGWEDAERPKLYLHLFNNFYSWVFIAFLIFLILRQIFREGPITPRRVQGSIAVYMLLGLLWAVSYEIVELLDPGSFSIAAQHRGATLPQLGYFSFTTLATLGLGDILPISPLARSLVVLEALVGQLFPVILIAQLATLESNSNGNLKNAVDVRFPTRSSEQVKLTRSLRRGLSWVATPLIWRTPNPARSRAGPSSSGKEPVGLDGPGGILGLALQGVGILSAARSAALLFPRARNPALEDTRPYLFGLLGIVEGDDPLRDVADRFPDRTHIREHRFPVTYRKFPVPISREFDEKAWAERRIFVVYPASKAPEIE